MSQIRLDPDLAARLEKLSQKEHRSLTNLVNLRLRRSLGMKATPAKRTSKESAASLS